ncbi:MAG: hypothetical protein IPN15_13245 [Saprospiraceae bacterium]|nr:hypothetical protein [Candidatus Vicinibacter affinis]
MLLLVFIKTKIWCQIPNQAARVVLPNGWSISPVGKSVALGDFPMQLLPSPSRKYLVIIHCGVSKHYLEILHTETCKQTDRIEIPKAWYGMAFNETESEFFVSGANDNTILKFDFKKGKLYHKKTIALGRPWPDDKICPTGLAVDSQRKLLFAGTKEDNSLYIIDLVTLKVLSVVKLESEAYACLYNKSTSELYVSLWGAKKILIYDVAKFQIKNEIKVGDHPNEMVLDQRTQRLFVCNSLDNSVSVLNLQKMKEEEVLNTALFSDAVQGTTPNSLCLNENGTRLYVANADNNCLAVFSLEQQMASESMGFIPTGWYPSSVRVVHDKIFIVNGKGESSMANPKGPQPTMKDKDERAAQYIGALIPGSLRILKEPKAKELRTFTETVYQNCPYSKIKENNPEGETGNPIPNKLGNSSPIKYVFYIIKENRTYDQVLGDIPEGNGDSSLCLFPQNVTPNQHALAKEFVLLDNFYVDSEVSADGHNWATAAYANDFVEKTWPTSYGGKGGNYDYEGTRKIAFPKNGFIWDYCKRKGVSYRTYGEFADDYKPNYETIDGHFCPGYSSWDLNYQDIARQKVWQADFDSLLAINQIPQFNTIRFGNDHTSGMARGAYTPSAAVADNDLAVGRFVDHLSHSSIWPESAIFILEDDAQNGPDHVDAHRSIAFVVSPYTRRKFVDHTHYTGSSMLRTMELILGLPPMSQYDASAIPMYRSFTNIPDFRPFNFIPNLVSIDERNAVTNELSKKSETFNLAELDAVPEKEFNEVLWKSIKGLDSEMPAPRRSAFVFEINDINK